MTPEHINPLQWHQALGVARQSCARFFRDGRTPGDAMHAFGLKPLAVHDDWSHAVEAIAETLCVTTQKRAA